MFIKIQATHLLLAGVSTISLWATAAPSYAQNLIVNGGAETYIGGPNSVADFPGWTRTGNVFADLYSSFPVTFIGGTPADIGSSYFFGGNQAVTSLRQTVGVSSIGTQIDQGLVSFDLSGLLGTNNATPLDTVEFSASFLDQSSGLLGRVSLFGPTAGELSSSAPFTAVAVSRNFDGIIPVGTRSVDFNLIFTRNTGTLNNGSADNLSFTVEVVPEPLTMLGVSTALGFGTLFKKRLAKSRTKDG